MPISHVFCCGICYDSVAIVEQPGGDLTYSCTNPACGKSVSVDCPEALAIIEDVILKLPIRKGVIQANNTAVNVTTIF